MHDPDKISEIELNITDATDYIDALQEGITLLRAKSEFYEKKANSLNSLLSIWVRKKQLAENEMETYRGKREEKKREGFSY